MNTQMPIVIDTLIFPRWIIPIEPENKVLENHFLAIHQGKIRDILPLEKADDFRAKEKIILSNHAVLPGFINAHTHTPMTLFRGLADDLALMEWLEHHIWPCEKKWLSDEFCYDGTRLAISEMLKSGTTCFNDNYFFLNGIGKAVQESHIRASLGACILDFPTAYGNDADDYLAKAHESVEQFHLQGLLSVNIAPHAPYTVSNHTFEKIKKFAEEYDLTIQVHLQETLHEVQESFKIHKHSPVERLDKLNILSNQTQAVHMTQISDQDFDILKKTGVHIVHCPESNLKLASGFCPVEKLMKYNINVALGTDGTASNNDLDMLGEMKIAAILAKAVAQDPCAVNAFQALKMATFNGARAMGISDQTGSLIKNKQADFIAIDLSFANTQPLYHPMSQIVYAANSAQITDVWVSGKHLLKNRKLAYMDEKEIIAKADDWKNKIIKNN